MSSIKNRLFRRNRNNNAVEEMMNAAIEQHQQGNLAQAESFYRKVLDLKPDHADCLHLLGLLTSQNGQFEQAIELINKAIEHKPDASVYYNNLGVTYFNQGNYKDSVFACNNALKITPDFVDAYYNLGNALFKLGQFEDAAVSYQKVLNLNPGHIDSQFNLGNTYKELQNLDLAISAFKKTIELNTKHADAYYNLGLLLEDTGQLEEAKTAYGQAILCNPDYSEAYYNTGNILYRQKQYDAAVNAFNKSLQINPGYADACNNLGVVLREQKKYDESKKYIRKAIDLKPDFAEAYHNLAEALIIEGNFDESENALMKTIEIMPDYAHAYYSLSTIKKFSEKDSEIVHQIETLLNIKSIYDDDAIYLNFAIAKIFDDCKEYDLAFKYFKAGNKLKRKKYNINIAENEAKISSLIKTFDDDFFKSNFNIGSTSTLPVFIIGMPRSGTTLIEQIIANHHNAYGAGELNYIGENCNIVTKNIIEHEINDLSTTELILEKFQNIIDGYTCELKSYSSNALRITDKMPTNFLYLGIIALLFPKSHIIHCQRNPLDTCLSIYFQNFSLPVEYAYSLTDIGNWYCGYNRLMKHWSEVLPVPVLNIKYEDLISSQHTESNKIIKYIGLDWDENCIVYQNANRPVLTASSWQVRQPIYKSSVERWKNYEKYLEPLKNILSENNISY